LPFVEQFFLRPLRPKDNKVKQDELQAMIELGVNQTQDFIGELTLSASIAPTLAAFANAQGGKLLIGVKNKVTIVGVEPDEVQDIIEEAAEKDCQPPVNYTIRTGTINGKNIVEVDVKESVKKPHFSPNEEGNPTVYLRSGKQNLLANRILMEVWKKQKQGDRTMLKVGYNESKLLNYLHKYHQITFSKFCGMANISPQKAEKILIHLVYMKILEMIFTEETIFYQMNSNPPAPEPNKDVVLGDF